MRLFKILEISTILGLTHRLHEGGGYANHGAKCAVRPLSWDLEASGVSFGRFGRCGPCRCAAVWCGGALVPTRCWFRAGQAACWRGMSPAAMRCLPNQRVMSAPVCWWCAASAVTRTWIWYAILVKSTLLCRRARQRRFHSRDLRSLLADSESWRRPMRSAKRGSDSGKMRSARERLRPASRSFLVRGWRMRFLAPSEGRRHEFVCGYDPEGVDLRPRLAAGLLDLEELERHVEVGSVAVDDGDAWGAVHGGHDALVGGAVFGVECVHSEVLGGDFALAGEGHFRHGDESGFEQPVEVRGAEGHVIDHAHEPRSQIREL